MQVKGIPLPPDAESRGMDWPAVGEPTPAELAAIEAQLEPGSDVIDWERWVDGLAAEVDERAEAFAGFGVRVPAQLSPRELAELPTAQLVELAAAGSMAAFEPLFSRFYRQMVRSAYNRTRDYAGRARDIGLAEDIVSEVWAQVLGKIAEGDWERRSDDPVHDFRSLLFGLVRRCVGAHFVNHWRERPVDYTESANGWLLDDTTADDTAADPKHDALVEKMHAGITELCDRQRDIVKLTLDGLSLAEIAATMGLSVPQVNCAKRQAEANLRSRLANPLGEATEAQLRDAIALLPDPQRQIVYMRVIEGLGHRPIAEALGLDYDRVRAIDKLAQINVRRTLVTPAAHGLGDLEAARAKRDKRLADLREAAEQLSPALRTVALLRLDGKSFAEIAAILGRTPEGVGTTWQRVQEALTRLGVLAEGSTIPVTAGQREPAPLGDLDAARAKRQAQPSAPAVVPNELLAQFLRTAGLSNKAFARLYGGSHTLVAHWLRGLKTPRPATAHRIADVLSQYTGRPVTLAELGLKDAIGKQGLSSRERLQAVA